MHYYFRTDGNEIIATGHVMRCLSIADACKDIGHEVTFITADDQCNDLIQQRGYNAINLAGKWNDLEYELDEIGCLISEHDVQILIIDSYYVTEKYLRTLKTLTKTVYIDDLNAFHYLVDVLINYSIYADKFNYPSLYSDTKLLLGCDYVPLRTQFRGIDRKIVCKEVQNILITTGGTDYQNVIGRLLNKMVVDKYLESISIHVVVGMFNANLDELRVIEKQYVNVNIHCNVLNMAELMKGADIAISAGGSTLYELAACGVPTITYSFADNQMDNVREFADRGLMEYAGDVRHNIDNCIGALYNMINLLVQNQEKRQSLSHQLLKLVDGEGTMRIAKELERYLN